MKKIIMILFAAMIIACTKTAPTPAPTSAAPLAPKYTRSYNFSTYGSYVVQKTVSPCFTDAEWETWKKNNSSLTITNEVKQPC